MSTYTLPRVGLSGLRELPDQSVPPPVVPPEDEDPPLREQADALVNENRRRATPDVLEKRKIPRVSIAELNAMDLDTLRERFQSSSFDERGPVTKVLDLLDLGRNQVAGLVAPTLAKRAKERGEVGTGGSGVVHGADILRDFGVSNRVLSAVGGFALDFVMDPLTYAGPAGWGARLATSARGGKGAVLALRGAGKRALRRSIEDVARGGAARDALWAPVIADAGYGAEKVAELRAAGKSAQQIKGEIETALRGDITSGRVGKVLSGVGGELDYAGGHINRFLDQTDLSAADESTKAMVGNVRAAVKKYGKGTGRSLRIGVRPGEVGSEIAHIPFTDVTLQVPMFSSAARQATRVLGLANDLKSGYVAAEIAGEPASRVGAAMRRVRDRGDTILERGQSIGDTRQRYAAQVADSQDADAVAAAADEIAPPPVEAASQEPEAIPPVDDGTAIPPATEPVQAPDAVAPQMDSPDPRIDLEAEEAAYAADIADLRAQNEADMAEIDAAMAELDPSEAAKNITAADHLITLSAMRDEAMAASELAAQRATLLERAKAFVAHPGGLESKSREEVVRELGEQIYDLAELNPEALDAAIEANAQAWKAADLFADAIKGNVAAFADGPMNATRLHAMSILGTDDYNIAVSAFNPMGRAALRRLGPDHLLTRTLFRLDSGIRRTLGVRGGAVERALVHSKTMRNDARNEVVRVAAGIEKNIGAVLARHGASGAEATADAMTIVGAEMFRLADPDGTVYHWTKWGENGPAGPSAMLEKLEAAKAKGYFDPKTHPGLLEDLKGVAGKLLDDLKKIGDVEVRDHMLGSLMAGYVPNVLTQQARRAVNATRRAFPKVGGGTSRLGAEGFDHMRTTWQTRFVDESGKWRRFFHGDRALAEMTNAERAAMFAGRPAELAQADDAIDAIRAYDARAAADPEFAAQFAPRPTDFHEVNDLYNQGRFRYLTGDNQDVGQFFETNPAHFMGVRMGMHQAARAKAVLIDVVRSQAYTLPDESALTRIAQNGEKTVRLSSGVQAKIGGIVQTNAGDSAASVLVGDRRYRMLSPRLRSSLDGNPIMEALGDDASKMLLPHELADRIEDIAVALGDERKLHDTLNFVDAVTSHWKMATLMSPAWAVFNVLGDGLLALTGEARLDHMMQGIPDGFTIRRALTEPSTLAGKTTTILGRETPMADVLALALKHRVFNHSLTLEAAGHTLMQAEAGRAALSSVPGYDRLMRRVVAPWFRINQFAQDFTRLLAFASLIKQGHSPVAAEQTILRSMFDYSDFTRVEERYFRTVYPFYSWMRNNLGYQFRMLLERPSYAAAVPRVKEAIEEAVNGEDGVPENMRPTWMREQLATQIGTDPERRIAVMLGNMLPQGDLFQALTPVVGVDGAMNFMHYFASQLNPVLGVPLQLGAGVETFSGRTIGASREEGDIGAGEFLASQFRPLAEYGPGGRLWKAADEGGAAGAGARFLIGGRAQGFGQTRIDSSLTREYDDRVRRMQAAVHRAERAGDRATSLRARTRLMQAYAEMQAKGLQVPQWATEQLEGFAVPQ